MDGSRPRCTARTRRYRHSRRKILLAGIALAGIAPVVVLDFAATVLAATGTKEGLFHAVANALGTLEFFAPSAKQRNLGTTVSSATVLAAATAVFGLAVEADGGFFAVAANIVVPTPVEPFALGTSGSPLLGLLAVFAAKNWEARLVVGF